MLIRFSLAFLLSSFAINLSAQTPRFEEETQVTHDNSASEARKLCREKYSISKLSPFERVVSAAGTIVFGYYPVNVIMDIAEDLLYAPDPGIPIFRYMNIERVQFQFMLAGIVYSLLGLYVVNLPMSNLKDEREACYNKIGVEKQSNQREPQ